MISGWPAAPRQTNLLSHEQEVHDQYEFSGTEFTAAANILLYNDGSGVT